MALAIGSTSTRRVTIDEARAISFMGPDLRVYSTPAMLQDVEFVCRDHLLTMIEPGQDSVGAYVELHHQGAAKLGEAVDITVTLDSQDGRRVRYSARVTLAGKPIGELKHDRAIVSVDQLRRRLKG
jgi:fluoroacetyl-CoA thioesterase